MLSEISTFDPPAGVVLPPLPPRLEPEEPVVEIGWSVPRNRERLTAGGTSFLLHLLLILLLAFFFSIPVDKTSSQEGLQGGWTRATFIVRKKHLGKLKTLALRRRVRLREILDQILADALSKNT